MKMEMPVEAEDEGDGARDPRRGGPGGLRGRRRSSSSTDGRRGAGGRARVAIMSACPIPGRVPRAAACRRAVAGAVLAARARRATRGPRPRPGRRARPGAARAVVAPAHAGHRRRPPSAPPCPSRWRRSRAARAAVRRPPAARRPAARSRGATTSRGTRSASRVRNRVWRRWGTDRLVRMLLRVAAEYRAAHPEAPRRRHRRPLAPARRVASTRRFGGIGHASHQNGLDVDVYYPRTDGQERRRARAALVDQRARAGPRRPLRGAPGAESSSSGRASACAGRRRVVQKLVHHDDHLHVRVRRAR